VLNQGLAAGASRFTRLEGIFESERTIWFTSTNGGDARYGQIFTYEPGEERLTLIVESAGIDALDFPDNLCVSPRGGLVLCEDGGRATQDLKGVTTTGEIFTFARNAVDLDEPLHGFRGDYRGSEWAGACFSPDGRWLFVNVYDPGFTVAITGPWREGLI
jgi:secreted PhoX family phosphatase